MSVRSDAAGVVARLTGLASGAFDIRDLKQRISTLLAEKQLLGLAPAATALLRRAPEQVNLIRKAIVLLAQARCVDQAEELLLEMIAATPSEVTGRVVLVVLAGGVSAGTKARLFEEEVIAVLPDDAIAALIRHLTEQQGISKAVELCRRALERSPQSIDLHLAMVGLLRALNDRPGARRQLEIALKIAPQDARVLRQMGRLESLAGNYEAAEQNFHAALATDPKNISVRLDLGRCLLNQKRYKDAVDFVRKTIALFPERAAPYAQLGHMLRWSGRASEALESYARALELAPDNALAMVETAQIREELGDCESSLDLHRRAAEVTGDPSYNASIHCYALLGAGRVREAFATAMNRVECRALHKMESIRVWQGEPLAGKSIMVIAENGVGDQIRDSCTYAELIEAADRVTISCEPRLFTLFERSFPRARFIPVDRMPRIADYERMLSMLIDDRIFAEMHQHDFCVLSPELLYHFRGDNALWGHNAEHLVPNPDLLDAWRQRVSALGPGLKVGISWRSGILNYNRECFYTRLLDWKPILTVPGVQFVNIQYDECEEEIRAAEAAFGIRIKIWEDLNRKDDFEGMAALLKQLDLVLAPNTVVLEQAGSIGVPAWYMIRVPIAYDHWRRMDETGQDRLYQSVRQIRGDRPWDSESLIASTARELRELVQRRAAGG